MATGSVVSRLSGRGTTFGRPTPVVRGANGTGGSMRASPSRHRGFCLLAALTVGLSVLSAASLARAAGVAAVAFPGKNGLIAFNSDGSVYVVSPNGSGLRLITQTGIQDGYPGVSFSPDGKLIAFSAMSATDPDIYTVRPDGSGRKPLTFSRGVDSDPTWSDDGKRIAFETNRNGNIDIYSVDRARQKPSAADERAAGRAGSRVVAEGQPDRLHGGLEGRPVQADLGDGRRRSQPCPVDGHAELQREPELVT